MTNRADRPIAVGDLVYLLRCPNPLHNKFAGSVRHVKEPSPNYPNQWRMNPPAVTSDGTVLSWHPRRLKRIPPLDEPAETYTTEPIKEKV